VSTPGLKVTCSCHPVKEGKQDVVSDDLLFGNFQQDLKKHQKLGLGGLGGFMGSKSTIRSSNIWRKMKNIIFGYFRAEGLW